MKTMRHTRPFKPFYGITLIELIVVIMIVAILAAILYPVFSAARDKARLNTDAFISLERKRQRS